MKNFYQILATFVTKRLSEENGVEIDEDRALAYLKGLVDGYEIAKKRYGPQ